MAFLTNQYWYCGSTKYTAVAQWAANTVYAAGALVRPLTTPAVGSERVFAAVVGGTSANPTEPTWPTTQGTTIVDNTVTWQDVTGKAGVNGDLTHTANWTTVKNTAVSKGVLIQRNSGGSLQICTTAGTASNGAEPSFSNTAGTTTADGTVTWTSLGAPGNFGAYAAAAARLNLFLDVNKFTRNADIVFVSNNHAETQATSISWVGDSLADLVQVYSVNDSAVPPTTQTTTSSITTTGASSISIGPVPYMDGIVMNAGTGAVTQGIILGSSGGVKLRNCSLNRVGTSAGNITLAGGTGGRDVIENTTFTFGNTGDHIVLSGPIVRIRGGTAAASGSVPTSLFTLGAGDYQVSDMDISNVTGTIATATSLTPCSFAISNSKTGSGATLAAAPNWIGAQYKMHNCDNGATNYNYKYLVAEGSVVSETSIVRTGGATDGTTALSWNMTTISGATANTAISYGFPLRSEEIAQWQDTTGSSKTASIEITTNATLTNAQCWLEIEYLGASGSPLGSIATSQGSFFSTTALTASSASWGGTAQTNKYTLSATFTPQMKGPIKAHVCVATASAIVYVDPLLTVALMDFSVTIEGLDKIAHATDQIKQAVALEINKGVYASAQQVVTEAKKSLLNGQKSGRAYKRRSIVHVASAPGEAPASDTGRLVNTIHAEAGDPGEALAISGSTSVLYAPLLEFGTSKMAARPFMFPALEKSKAWITARLQDALRIGLGQ